MKHQRIGVFFLSAVFTASTIFAQRPGGGGGGVPTGGGSTGAGGGTIGSPSTGGAGRPTLPGTSSGTIYQPSSPSRPIFFSGKVVLDDGLAPPTQVLIESVCGVTAKPEAYTDSKGHFSFQFGANRAMLAEADTPSSAVYNSPGSSGMGGMNGTNTNSGFGSFTRSLDNCDLRASLAGYHSDVVHLAGHHSMDNPDVGTIVLKRMGNVQGLTISAISLAAPKDAQKAYEKGLSEVKQGNLLNAEKRFEKAVEVYPRYATAWYELGKIHAQSGDADGARSAFQKAMSADPKFVSPYDDLTQIELTQKKWQDVADLSDRWIRLNPMDFPQAYEANAVAYVNLNKLDKATKSVNELIKMDTAHRFPASEHVLGVICAKRGELHDAATHLRAYLAAVHNGPEFEEARRQLIDVEKLAIAQKLQADSDQQDR